MCLASLPNVLLGRVALPLAFGWDWWLPPDYSKHGRQIDVLFNWVFWITSAVGIGVMIALVWFSVKYRRRPGRLKAVFTHGNTPLEMAWTLIPAVILLGISVVSKRVWDNYRYAPVDTSKTIKILVIAEQYKWNVIYPGPDGKLGRYLLYPKVTDLHWPAPPPGQDPWPFPSVPGPAYLPEEQARKALDGFIEAVNPLGKDFSDPNGLDDDWQQALGRPVYLPTGRQVEINLASRDVIHDFFAPNFRVKLDAVPGMRGLIYLTAEVSSADFEARTRRMYSLDELAKLLAAPNAPKYRLIVPPEDPRVDLADKTDLSTRRYFSVSSKETIVRDGGKITSHVLSKLKSAGVAELSAYAGDDKSKAQTYTLTKLKKAMSKDESVEFHASIAAGAPHSDLEDPKDPSSRRYIEEKHETVQRDNAEISSSSIADLRAIGLTQVRAYERKSWEVVCEQFCGQGHFTMRDDIVCLGPEATDPAENALRALAAGDSAALDAVADSAMSKDDRADLDAAMEEFKPHGKATGIELKSLCVTSGVAHACGLVSFADHSVQRFDVSEVRSGDGWKVWKVARTPAT